MRGEVRAGRRAGAGRCGHWRRICGMRGKKARLRAWGSARARAERTENMPPMLVTLEVSKLLSGWLNTFAFCRVERRARDAVRAGREAAQGVWGDGSASGMREEGPTQGLGGTGHAQSARGTWSPCS